MAEADLEIRNIDGDVLCSVQAKATTTVNELKVMIELKLGIPMWEQKLYIESSEGLCGVQIDESFSMRERLGLRVFNSEAPCLLLVRLSSEEGERRHQELAYAHAAHEAMAKLTKGVSLGELGWPHTSNEELALKAVSRKVTELRHADKSLLTNPHFMASAVRVQKDALEYAARELWSSKIFVSAACSINGTNLQRASTECREDRDVVLGALSQNGLALKYASEDIRGDREVVFEAVRQKGVALAYASPELKADKEIVLQAVRNERMAIVHASPELKQDPEVREACNMQRELSEVTMAGIESQRLIREQFRRADTNGDGTIDVDELAAILKVLDSSNWTHTRAYKLLLSADINHDGVIDIDEFVEWITSASNPADQCVHSAAEKWNDQEYAAE
eukprot:TRINITY_DN4983_c0_g1_i2.p1 TRINITY_DN4983_c0_g1~~TRINITY_DN4983_c0_g1_i2.p1  ORF type:complete len:393 (+),score=69.11 TRINITY_DN4983_c0_g1_i2:107-1285(+)